MNTCTLCGESFDMGGPLHVCTKADPAAEYGRVCPATFDTFDGRRCELEEGHADLHWNGMTMWGNYERALETRVEPRSGAMTLEEALQEIERLRYVLSVRVDAESNPKGPQTLLDTYDQTNPAWIDAMMHGTYGPMPERLKAPTPILGMIHIDGSDDA